MYISYVREWYRDPVNFRTTHTYRLDEMSLRQRKLLNRLDARTYPYILEAEMESQQQPYSHLKTKNFVSNDGMELERV